MLPVEEGLFQVYTKFQQTTSVLGAPRTRLIVAVSGGPDSMALIEALYTLKKSAKLDAELVVAHVDHNLRDDSIAETELLQDYCATRGLVLEIKKWPAADHPTKGVEAAAREFRYSFFSELTKKYVTQLVLTAHHGDDLLENVLIKLIRSGDVREMTKPSIVTKLDDLVILRPFLQFSKNELLEYCEKKNVDFINDVTNDSDFTVRNRLRHNVVPLLKRENKAILQNVTKLQEQIGQYEMLLTTVVDQLEQPQMLGGFHDGIFVAKLDSIQKYPSSQRALILEKFIGRYLHKSVRVEPEKLAGISDFGVGKVVELREKVKIIFFQNRYYLVDEELVTGILGKLPDRIELNNSFLIGEQELIVTDQAMDAQLLGTFAVSPTSFGDKPIAFGLARVEAGTKVLLANGQHQLVKKRFTKNAIPKALRSMFFGIVNPLDNEFLWIDMAYSNQAKMAQEQTTKIFYIYQLLKNFKEK